MKLIIKIFLLGLAVLITSYVLPGATVQSYLTAVWVGVLIAFVNATLGFILKILTLPLSIITLGLFAFLINVCMLMLVDNLVTGFALNGFLTAVFFAIILSLVNMLLFSVLDKEEN